LHVEPSAVTAQTFFIPLQETTLLDQAFSVINTIAKGEINTMISVTISTDNTVIFYDHHEDGYVEVLCSARSGTYEYSIESISYFLFVLLLTY
jgi:hypothetical protein